MYNLDPDIIKFILTFVGSFLILYLVKTFIVVRLKNLSKKTSNKFDDLLIDLVNKLHIVFYISLSLFIAFSIINIPQLEKIVSYIILVNVFYYGIIFSQGILKFFIEKNINADNKHSLSLMHKILNFVIVVFAVLLLLQNFGVNLTSVIAGLGVTGIAIAFALQNILGDIFAYFTIHFDKPFKEGDFINVGEEYGVVKKIGIKSTRIENLLGDEIVFSNKDLTEARVHNYKKMEKRRNTLTVGVEYDTDISKLEKIKEILNDIVKDIQDIEIANIVFDELSSSSLNFTVIYYVLDGDYNKHLNIKDHINFEIIKKFKENNINFAFPSQTVYVRKE